METEPCRNHQNHSKNAKLGVQHTHSGSLLPDESTRQSEGFHRKQKCVTVSHHWNWWMKLTVKRNIFKGLGEPFICPILLNSTCAPNNKHTLAGPACFRVWVAPEKSNDIPFGWVPEKDFLLNGRAPALNAVSQDKFLAGGSGLAPQWGTANHNQWYYCIQPCGFFTVRPSLILLNGCYHPISSRQQAQPYLHPSVFSIHLMQLAALRIYTPTKQMFIF